MSLAAFSTKVELAMYSVSFMLITAIATAPAAMMNATMPSVATHMGAGRADAVEAALARALRVTLVFSVPITAVAGVLGPGIVLLLYGDEFAPAASLVRWMSLVLLLAPAFSLLRQFWSGVGSVRIPLVAIGVGGVVDLTAAAGLIPGFGDFGATIANVLGQTVAALILIALSLRRICSLHLGMGRYAVVLLFTVVASGAAGLVATWLGGPVGWPPPAPC